MVKKKLLAVVSLITLMLLSSGLSVSATGGDYWVEKAAMPIKTGRALFGAQAVDGKIYTIGGYVNSQTNEVYDSVCDTWDNLAPMLMPTGRTTFGITTYENKIYAIGGWESTQGFNDPNFMPFEIAMLTGACEVYDPISNTWETKAPMPTPRNYLQANVVDGKIYLIGGLTQQEITYPLEEHASNLTEVYNPATDSWTTMTPIPTPVWGYVSAVVDGKIYIISGWTGDSSMNWGQSASLCDLVQIFDPQTNSWTVGAPIPQPIVAAGAGATSGEKAPKRIYIFGGSTTANIQQEKQITDMTQIYDPETNTWSTGDPMPTERYDLGVAVVDDRLYALGGAGESLVNVNEKYTPVDYGQPQPSLSPSPIASGQDIGSPQNLLIQVLPAIGALCVVLVAVGIIVFYRRRNRACGSRLNQPSTQTNCRNKNTTAS